MCCGRCLALCFVCVLALGAYAHPRLWLPGKRYEHILQYGFDSSNVTVTAKEWKGKYVARHIKFAPIIQFTTEGVTNIGANTYAYRVYHVAKNIPEGFNEEDWPFEYTENMSWLDEQVLKFKRYKDKDLQRRWSEIERIGKGLDFHLFQLVGDRSFDEKNQKLLFCWKTVPQSQRTAWKIDVRSANLDDCSYECCKHPIMPRAIVDAVNAESETLYSSMSGAWGLRDDDGWEMDANNLNALLVGDISKKVRFEGKLRVRRSIVPVDLMGGKFCNDRFTGVMIQVEDSRGACVKVNDTRFDCSVAPDMTSNVELWFDGVNETLRFAKIRITIPHYDGEMPNPELDKLTRNLKGEMSGNFSFTCEYTCHISEGGVR